MRTQESTTPLKSIARHESPAQAERRRFPRIQLFGDLHGRAVLVGIPIVVRDISPSGFAVESAIPFPLGAEHRFAMTSADGQQTTISARCVHSVPSEQPWSEAVYVAGFVFTGTESERAMRDISDTLLTPAS